LGKGERKIEQHSFENHSRQCSDGRALDLQTVSCWFESRQLLALFFLEIIPFAHTFLLSTLGLGIQATYRGGTQGKLNACHLGTRILL